jgi:hypothetical protein
MGTCAMAKRGLHGVVDPSLKVYGTTNLRVVDASIFPMHVAAHLQSTTYAIGEKVSSLARSWSSLCANNRVAGCYHYQDRLDVAQLWLPIQRGLLKTDCLVHLHSRIH